MRRVPDAVRARLVDLAVCSWEDFHTEDAVAVCERCAVPPDSPEAACCTRADCPRRVMGQSELETAA